MYRNIMCWLLLIITKSSAYLTTCTPRALLLLGIDISPSEVLTLVGLLTILCSVLLVKGQIASRTTFSNPLRVILANVGLMIPPCGVPVLVSLNFFSYIVPDFSQLSKIIWNFGGIITLFIIHS